VIGGLGLAALSAGGEVGGLALDATGVGAVVGAPANAVSAAGITVGLGLAAAGMSTIVARAAGADRVNMSSDGGGSGGMSNRDIHGAGRISERGVDVTYVWDHGDMYVQGDGQIVKVLDNGNGTYDVVIRDMANPRGQPTTVLKDATQKYVDRKIAKGDWQ
jgi:hypothetical protein